VPGRVPRTFASAVDLMRSSSSPGWWYCP
jgi:hypothetical protein